MDETVVSVILQTSCKGQQQQSLTAEDSEGKLCRVNTGPAVTSSSRLCGLLHQDSCGQILVGDFHALNGSLTGVIVAGVYLVSYTKKRV